MTSKELRKNKTNYAIINTYEIELVIFIKGYSISYFKDIETNRCYEETGTKDIKQDAKLVKRRIKNSVFDEILTTCVVAD